MWPIQLTFLFLVACRVLQVWHFTSSSLNLSPIWWRKESSCWTLLFAVAVVDLISLAHLASFLVILPRQLKFSTLCSLVHWKICETWRLPRICLPVWLRVLQRIFMKFYIWEFFENLFWKFKFHWSSTWITGTLHEDPYLFMISCSVPFRIRNVSDKICAENQNIHSISVFLNRRAAARYRALASIIPGRKRFPWNLSFQFSKQFSWINVL